MSKLCTFLFSILLCLSGCKNKDNSSSSEVSKSEFTKESIKILAVGNSYTAGAITHLYSILEGFGVEEIIIGNMYMPATDVTDQRYYIENNMPIYTYRKCDSNSESKGMIIETKNIAIETAICDEEWNIIIFPNMKRINTFDSKKYDKEDRDFLLDYFERKCPNVPIYWHMTWAFQSDYQDAVFTSLNNDQIYMYNKIIEAVKNNILPEKRFKKIIPAGTAIQNARTSYLGDTLTMDGYHLNSLGNYIAGLTWVLCITGWDISEFNTSVVPVTFRQHYNVIYESAINAINVPYEITNSNYKVK